MSESGLLSTLFSPYFIIRRSMIIDDESYCVVWIVRGVVHSKKSVFLFGSEQLIELSV